MPETNVTSAADGEKTVSPTDMRSKYAFVLRCCRAMLNGQAWIETHMKGRFDRRIDFRYTRMKRIPCFVLSAASVISRD